MALYTGDARRAVAFPLGGLGTGHVALCGDGALRQWQLLGVPNHGALLPDSFFALRVSSLEPPADAVRLLRAAPLPPAPVANASDGDVPDRETRWRWPFVADTTFGASYPFARVAYHDPGLPVAVALEAHTPFVPLDADASALPLVRYRFTIRNDSAEFRFGFLLGTLQNAAGWDGVTPISGTRGAGYGGNVNRLLRRPGQSGVLMDHPGLAEDDPAAGELLLWTDAPAAVLPRAHDADALLRFVETLRMAAPSQLGDWSEGALRAALRDVAAASPMRAPAGPSPAGHTWDAGVAAAFALLPGESATIDLVHAWWFPNRHADFDRFGPQHRYGPTRFWIGNHYATRFGGALDVLDAYLSERDRLDTASRAWAEAVETSDLPEPLRETIAAQPALVRSPSVFRTADGRTFAFEGALGASTRNWNGDAGGSCPINCNHVLNYEQALSRLFPSLGRDMRETEFQVQAADGSIPHRVVLPLYLPQLNGVPIGGPERPALDGMLGAVLKTYRSVLDGSGLPWLRSRWPALLALMSHLSATWDAGGDGVLRGDQPVTYDISLHGPNMFVGALWLAALRAMSAMSALLDAPDSFGTTFEKAAKAYDDLLWNGEFYAQPNTGEAYDFGRGCLADQLFGQWWAHELGLGHLLPPDRVRSALRSIVRYNLRTGFEPHGYREFADGDETGLVVCTWPHGGRPTIPLRYCDEVWTGVEYQVAAHCFHEGLDEEGLAIVRGVRSRYDGRRRNPFNEIECGDHYVRAMAGWSLLTAWSGVRHDATAGTRTNGTRPGRFPYVAGTSWGTLTVAADGTVTDVLASSPPAG